MTVIARVINVKYFACLHFGFVSKGISLLSNHRHALWLFFLTTAAKAGFLF